MTTGKEAIAEVVRELVKSWPIETVVEYAEKDSLNIAFIFKEELERRNHESRDD